MKQTSTWLTGCTVAFTIALNPVGGCQDQQRSTPSDAPADQNSTTDPSDPSLQTGTEPTARQPMSAAETHVASNGDCVRDRVAAPDGGQGCSCQWSDCQATQAFCGCDTGAGGSEPDIPFSDGCETPNCHWHDYLGFICDINGCKEPPYPPPPPPIRPVVTTVNEGQAHEVAFDRKPVTVRVLFVVDNSLSMFDNQMAAVCAIDSFFETASANDAKYEIGVITTDMFGDMAQNRSGDVCTNPGSTYDKETKVFRNSPGLVGLSKQCDFSPECVCGTNEELNGGTPCAFNNNGNWVPSGSSESEERVKKLMAQGDACSHYEGGLEQTLQFFVDLKRKGELDGSIPYEVIFVTDEDADARATDGGKAWLCPASSVQRGLDDAFSPPPLSSSEADCSQSLAEFYTAFLEQHQIIAHGLLYTPDCANESTESVGSIYQAVIDATNGQSESVCHCERFSQFFSRVGQTTSHLSTSLCLRDSEPELSNMVVSFVDGGNTQVVPQSATNGWTYDQGINCVLLHGRSWENRYGNYRLTYQTPGMSVTMACLQADAIPSTIRVHCEGVEILESSTDGWTFDPESDCLHFHGSRWEGSSCAFDIKYI